MNKPLLGGIVAATALWPAVSGAQTVIEREVGPPTVVEDVAPAPGVVVAPPAGYIRVPPPAGYVEAPPAGYVEVAPPDEVVTYVQRERVPSVRVDRDVTVGYAVPDSVELRSVPRYDAYDYAVINDRPVIVEPRSRRVIRVLD